MLASEISAQLGQVLEALECLDLQHHAQLAPLQQLERVQQLVHVVGPLDK
jgi:hypothetical protein